MQQVHRYKWDQQRTRTGRSLPGRQGIGVGSPEDVDSWTPAMGAGPPVQAEVGCWAGLAGGQGQVRRGKEMRSGQEACPGALCVE